MLGKIKDQEFAIMKTFRFKVLLISIMIIIMENISIANCGTTSEINPTTELQDLYRQFAEELNENEVNEFGRQIQFQPERGWPENQDALEHPRNNVRWESIALFAACTVMLFIINRYSTQILDNLYNTGIAVTTSFPDVIHNIYPRQEVIEFGQNLLQTPEGQQRVIHAMNHIRQLRNATGG